MNPIRRKLHINGSALSGMIARIGIILLLSALTMTATWSQSGSGEEWLEQAAVSQDSGDYVAAVSELGKAAAAFSKVEDWNAAGRSWSKQAKVYRDDLGDMDEAIASFTRVIDLHRTHSEERRRDINVAHFYNLIGNVFQRKSDYDQAILVYQKSIDLRSKVFGARSQKVGQILTNMGTAYRFKKQYEKARELYRQALDIQFNSDEVTDLWKVAIIFNQMGEVCSEQGIPDTAKHYFEQSLTIFQHMLPQGSQYFVSLYLNLGNVQLVKDKPDEALKWFEKAWATFENGPWYQNHELVQTLVYMGRASVKKGAIDKGIGHFQQAMGQMVPDYRPATLYDNPDQEHLTSDPWIFLALLDKAEAHYLKYRLRGHLPDLETAFATYESVCEFADLRRAAYWSLDAKKALADEVYPVYEKAIATALELHLKTRETKYLHRAFVISERSKAALILENLKREAALPPQVLDNIKALERTIARLQEDLFYTPDASPQHQVLKDRLFLLQEDHDRQLASYKETYLGFSPGILSADSVRQNIPEGSAILEYFLGADSLYIFVLDGAGLQLFARQVPPDLASQIETLRKQCDHPPERRTSSMVHHFGKDAHLLYQTLMGPVEGTLKSSEVKKLIVVPDGPLWHLPFEVLVRKSPPDEVLNFGELDWLIKDFEISYAYSGTLLERVKKKPSERSREILAIAPDYGFEKKAVPGSSRNDSMVVGFSPLAWSREEVDGLASHFRAELLTGEAATEAEFKQKASQFGGIHFSTHASLNDQDPMYSFISFGVSGSGGEDDSLFLYELYDLELNAEMVVLSACETGAGGLVKGEGIMSLARGFARGGCPSVIMSLWKADDQSTYEIMQHFYESLAAGKTKSRALQDARLNYLSSAEGRYQHPYYWAHIVAWGDAGPVDFARKKSFGRWWMIFGFLAAGLGSLWWKRRKRRKK